MTVSRFLVAGPKIQLALGGLAFLVQAVHRFYLPPDECRQPTLTLQDREAHHAALVLRLRKNESVTVLDGAGGQFLCDVQDVSKKSVLLVVREKNLTDPLPCKITLFQAIPKGKTMDLIIQKATELGATRIIPLLTERVVTHLDQESAAEKQDKWQTVAIEAIKQCGQAWLPKVEKPIAPKEFIGQREKYELSLIGALQPGSRSPREYLKQFSERNQRLPQTAAVWIGPEGDFTPSEMEMIISSGVLPITLGRLVLRCETAAIYCLSILNYELQP